MPLAVASWTAIAATLASDEYALLTGPVLSRVFFERRPVTDEFISTVVTQWLTTRQRHDQLT